MYISRFILHNWKNFQNTEATLSRRVFLIGPNASGKSNFLDAFRFLREIARGGINQAIETRGGVSPVRCLAARASSSIALEIVLSSDDAKPMWSYRIEFNQDSHRKPTVRQEKVVDLVESRVILERPEMQDEADPLRLTQTSLEQIVANKEFRQIADFLETISYQHLVPQVVRDPKGFSPAPVTNDPFGRDLLIRIYSTDVKIRDARLRRIGKVLSQAVPQLQSLQVEMDPKGIPHLIGRYEHWRPHAAKQNESQFSDGTLRLFGLMWAMLEGSGPILIEEPELSLHPEVVRNLPQLLVQLQEEARRMKRRREHADRQVIISTHSPEMLSDRGIAPSEVIRIQPSPEGSTLVLADEDESKKMEQGLSAADVLLPKSSPLVESLILGS
jgi:predicted ATPase